MPWACPDGTERVAGSLHRVRVLVPTATLRRQLHRFFSRPPKSKGSNDADLAPAEYSSLLQTAAVEASEAHCFAPYLVSPAATNDHVDVSTYVRANLSGAQLFGHQAVRPHSRYTVARGSSRLRLGHALSTHTCRRIAGGE